MIFNEQLDRLMEVEIVHNFMRTHNLKGKKCNLGVGGKHHSFVLYRLPYLIGFWDSVIENYLEIVFVDLDANLLIDYGSPISIAVDLGLQSPEVLRKMNFDSHDQLDIFLSEGGLKMYCLHTAIEALDKLLPLIEAKGGLSSMLDGTFDPRFDFSTSVRPMYPGLKEGYLKCIDRDK